MSVKYMNAVWDSTLAGNQLLVALALADWAGKDGDQIFPTVLTVAKKTRLSERTVQRLVKQMLGIGLLQIVSPARQHQAAHYHMSMVWLCARAGPGADDGGDDGGDNGVNDMSRGEEGGDDKPRGDTVLSPLMDSARGDAMLSPLSDEPRGDTVLSPLTDSARGDAMLSPLSDEPRGDKLSPLTDSARGDAMLSPLSDEPRGDKLSPLGGSGVTPATPGVTKPRFRGDRALSPKPPSRSKINHQEKEGGYARARATAPEPVAARAWASMEAAFEPASFNAWLKPCRLLIESDAVTIDASTQFRADTIRSEFASRLATLFGKVTIKPEPRRARCPGAIAGPAPAWFDPESDRRPAPPVPVLRAVDAEPRQASSDVRQMPTSMICPPYAHVSGGAA